MLPSRPILLASLALASLGLVGSAAADLLPEENGRLAGRVLGEGEPLASVTVYAYQLADLTLRKVVTNPEGRFAFDSLPAGLYQVVAHRSGFIPAMTVISRASGAARQFLELQLIEEAADESGSQGSTFWSLRERIPADVLRDLQLADVELASVVPSNRSARFETRMEAITGIDDSTPAGEMALAGGRVGIRGSLGEFAVDLRGAVLRVGGPFVSPQHHPAGGTLSSVSVRLEGPQETRLGLHTRTDRLVGFYEGEPAPVDFEQMRVDWTRPLGERMRSEISAYYASETNFFRQTWMDPVQVPDASRAWRLEGALSGPLNDRAAWRAGLRYRVYDGSLSTSGVSPVTALTPTQQMLSIFGEGTLTLAPSLLLEYGATTAMRDGGTFFIPDLGLVVQLTSSWQLAASATHRFWDEAERLGYELLPLYVQDLEHCDQAEAYCYRVFLSRQTGHDNELQIGAVHREFAETLRLFFSDNPLNRSDSLYMVPGDRVPELQVAIVRRLSSKLVTRLESSVGAGGGGSFVAANHQTYENSVRYAQASLDARYQPTATAIALAFHLLEQEFQAPQGLDSSTPQPASLERIQLLLNQDLNVLLDLAADWALLVNLELARGDLAATSSSLSPEEYRKRLMAGVSVRF